MHIDYHFFPFDDSLNQTALFVFPLLFLGYIYKDFLTSYVYIYVDDRSIDFIVMEYIYIFLKKKK